MENGKGAKIRIRLEITGGFTGPAGKQVIALDLDRLPQTEAAELRSQIESIPQSAWGARFFAAHPKSWDFRHLLQVEGDDGVTRKIEFHRGQGPPQLTALGEKVIALNPGE